TFNSFFFQAEDGIRDFHVTGVQTCALPISPSNSAVPFWLAVAPMVSTKRDTFFGSLRFSSATLSAVGRVALLEAVENAISIASCTPRKNAMGDQPPTRRSASE